VRTWDRLKDSEINLRERERERERESVRRSGLTWLRFDQLAAFHELDDDRTDFIKVGNFKKCPAPRVG
jgi:hypothetical protein